MTGKIAKKCDGFVHYLAFGIRFRLRILVNGAVGRWATTKYSVGRGLYAPYHGLRRVAGRSICPIYSPAQSGEWSMYPI